MNRIRVALLDLQPRRLRDVVIDAVSDAPDLVLVSPEPVSESQLREGSADVVVASAREPGDDRLPARLLALAPRLRVVMVAVNGRTAAMWEMRPHKTLRRSITRSGLIAAIRRSMQRREEE